MRAIERVPEEDATKRLLPMNCLSWNVGHLAWQEQKYFLQYGQGKTLFPDVAEEFAVGAPASTPPLKTVLSAWRAITEASDQWLDEQTSADLEAHVIRDGNEVAFTHGNLLQRVIYHYWYHLGENMAIRQQLGHGSLPQFVGNVDEVAPYRTR
jgi:uncharacterized damage-inducible protein DinB